MGYILRRLHRPAINTSGGRQLACNRHRQIALPQMHALRTTGQRNVDAVIDNQWNAQRQQQLHQRHGLRIQVAAAGLLVA